MKLYKKLIKGLFDPARSYEERTLVMFSVIGDLALLIAVIFDIIGKESRTEIITLIVTILAIPLSTYLSVRFRKVRLGSLILVCALVFFILPITFFYGGGVKGGGIYWIIFGYMLIGMLLSGALRVLMMACLTFLAGFEYYAAYKHTEWIYPHTYKMSFVDAIVSVLLVGICTFVMLMYQKTIFNEESKRARAEADRAEELNRSQNRFFSSMSHEIRTPINSILGLNEVILRQDDASDEIKRDASNIQGAGRLLLSLINDLLDFSKIEAGSMDIVPVDYKVGDMMSEIVNMIWLRANEKGLSFDVDIDPHVPSVLFGDEVRIKQIIINLLNNAVKYTKKGSVGLHIEAEDADEGKVRLLISVSDTGIGIKQEMLPDLFNVFKRVDQEKNRNIEGTGLGLSIVKQLVDLMGGDISVNSAYGQGSTFTVSLVQEISDSRMLGNINISSQGETHHRYEHMFTASDARILIVDDNEMNLEVERKLLTDTRLTVDTAKSGTEALGRTLEKHYDVILMDHLMPGMDGVECLKNIRSQTGGLNVDVPAVVLTANAGSQNRELYNASGFDGYLVKPVSGSELEEMLIKFIPQDKLILNKTVQMNSEEVSTARGYSRKQPVVFTSSSLCDIPETLRKRMGIDILYHTIVTDEGMFRDNVEMSADETVRYMDSGRDAKGVAPEVAAYEEFFGRLLRKAHHVIYIALTTSMSEDYERAMMAARSFGNVTVINSECMSSSLALLLLVGYKLAQQNVPVERIVAELENVKKRMHSGFIMGTTEYMARKGLVGQRIHRIASSMELRPALRYKNDKYSIGGLWMGSIRHCYEGYIKKSLPLSANPDPDILFVTYVAIPEEELIWIEKQIRKRCDFEHIIFQQASSVITTNSGPGTFGLLYMQKGQRSYNLGSLLPNDVHYDDGDAQEDHISDEEVIKTKPAIREWYDELEGIDGSVAIENSGSEEAFRTVLKMFYDAIPEKADEIDTYFKNGDWNDYTIKVHALKSSAKLIGALGLSEEAAKLEDAGKSQDTGYINENHEAMMERYREYRIKLANLFAEPPDTDIPAKPAGKPEADEELILMAIDELNDAAGEKDSERIKNVLAELDDYSIPDKYGKMWDEIINAADGNGFETIIGLLKEHKA